jgi:hypothetical protein
MPTRLTSLVAALVLVPAAPAADRVMTYLCTPGPDGSVRRQSSVPGSDEGDGLDEVNAKRAAAGLRPFVRDDGLTTGAKGCATFRARHLMFGHVTGGMGDFQFAPPGSRVASTGCAAYPDRYGWMSCDVYDNYTYAGAWWVRGADGKRYMSLFVR